MQNAPTRTPGLELGGGSSWYTRATRWLADAAVEVLGPSDQATQRQDVLRRALIAVVIIAILPIQQLRIPGWEAVLIACCVALLYDIPLGYLVFVKQRYLLVQLVGLVLDSIILMGASLFVFREMAAAGSSSDLWLVFVVYIMTGGFTMAPIGSLFYTGLWIGWFALATLLYFPPGSHYMEELPLRMVFLAMIGVVSLGMARELEKRRLRLEQQNRQTMGMLATLVEARDTDAGAHLHRIQHFAKALALHVGVSPREAQEIAYASMVHDVGKANVPDAVLKKSGPLTVDERRIVQQHTEWGDELLADNSDFEVARQVARWHHERWDGSGYPDGLAGEDIPAAARIVAVADVYDALISKRPYKEAWSPDAAIREIRRLSGAHLDGRLVDAFVELWEWGVIQRITAEIEEKQPADGHALEEAA
jgi:hypothetical protein